MCGLGPGDGALDRVSSGRAYLGLARGAWLDTVGVTASRRCRRWKKRSWLSGACWPRTAAASTVRSFASNPARVSPSCRSGRRLKYWSGPGVRALPRWRAASGLRKSRSAAAPTRPWSRRWRAGFRRIRSRRRPRRRGWWSAPSPSSTRTLRWRGAWRASPWRPTSKSSAPSTRPSTSSGSWRRAWARCAAPGAPPKPRRWCPTHSSTGFCFAGTPDDIAAQAEALFDAGAQRVEFGPPHGASSLVGIALLGEDVLPRLRAL